MSVNMSVSMSVDIAIGCSWPNMKIPAFAKDLIHTDKPFVSLIAGDHAWACAAMRSACVMVHFAMADEARLMASVW